jgi:hypothetical protein
MWQVRTGAASPALLVPLPLPLLLLPPPLPLPLPLLLPPLLLLLLLLLLAMRAAYTASAWGRSTISRWPMASASCASRLDGSSAAAFFNAASAGRSLRVG